MVIQFKVDDRFYWECVRRREVDESQKCYARARTVLRGNEHHIVAHGEHSHLSDLLAVETNQYRNLLKRKARESDQHPEKIIRSCAAETPTEVSGTVL